MLKFLKRLFYLAVIGGIAGGGWWHFMGRGAQTWYLYRTQPVTRGAITVSVSATGTVKAVETVDVGTQVSGKIKEIYADFNSVVTEGQLIALLDPDVLESQLEQSRASLALSQAGAASARASLTDAERTYKRNKELFDRKLIARSQVDDSETKLLLARASLTEANARVVQSKASLKQAQTNLDYSKIVSPVDGVVISRKVDVGQTVAASMSTPTLFQIARDLRRMNIEVTVDEADIGRIVEGQQAICKFDAWPKDSFEGKVFQVRLEAATVSNVVTYTVVINIDNSELKLKPGMTANVTIITEKRENALRVPAAALRFTPPADEMPAENSRNASSNSASPLGMMPRRFPGAGNQNRADAQKVWLVENGRIAGSVEIAEQGVSDRTWIEVLGDTGLREGQQLAVSFSKETGVRPADLDGAPASESRSRGERGQRGEGGSRSGGSDSGPEGSGSEDRSGRGQRSRSGAGE